MDERSESILARVSCGSGMNLRLEVFRFLPALLLALSRRFEISSELFRVRTNLLHLSFFRLQHGLQPLNPETQAKQYDA